MKKHSFYGGLFFPFLLITTSCNYLTSNVKNTRPLEQEKHAQDQLMAIHSTPDKKSSPLLRSGLLGLLWIWSLTRFYSSETRRRIPGRKLKDFALLKIIKTNALQLWNTHRPDRKIIRLEEQRS